jgi:hypothetical protein
MAIGSIQRLIAASAALVLCAGSLPTPASAQLFSGQLLWDWGGGTEVGGSGREIVRFSPQFAAGEIVVSFGDRRLYFVTQPGQAISYPIAIPREEDRWAGVTKITSKRVDPSWTPTPTMLAENPRLPRWVPGGHPMNPLGVRALYLDRGLPNPRHRRPWTIGTAGLEGLHPPVQSGCSTCILVFVGAKPWVAGTRFNSAPGYASSSLQPSGPRLRECASPTFQRF